MPRKWDPPWQRGVGGGSRVWRKLPPFQGPGEGHLGRVTLGSLGSRLLRWEALKTASLGLYKKAEALETMSAPLREESG